MIPRKLLLTLALIQLAYSIAYLIAIAGRLERDGYFALVAVRNAISMHEVKECFLRTRISYQD